MGLRKAGAYSKKKVRPYTRKSKSRAKSYIKTIPQPKIVKFIMGNTKAFEQDKYKRVYKLICQEKVQIRDNAIEACRQLVNKDLSKNLAGIYYFVIKIHPHHILRENKMLTGAGSDRMQTGMQKSFGKTMGRAAIVKKDAEIFVVGVNSEKGEKIARQALGKAKAKLPCKTKIVFEKHKKHEKKEEEKSQ